MASGFSDIWSTTQHLYTFHNIVLFLKLNNSKYIGDAKVDLILFFLLPSLSSHKQCLSMPKIRIQTSKTIITHGLKQTTNVYHVRTTAFRKEFLLFLQKY